MGRPRKKPVSTEAPSHFHVFIGRLHPRGYISGYDRVYRAFRTRSAAWKYASSRAGLHERGATVGAQVMECTDVGCPQAGRCPHKWTVSGDLRICQICELTVSLTSWRGLLHRWGVPLESIHQTAVRLNTLGYDDDLLELAAVDLIADGYDPRRRSRSAPGWKLEHAARRRLASTPA